MCRRVKEEQIIKYHWSLSSLLEANNGIDFIAPWLGFLFSKKPGKGPVIVLAQKIPCGALLGAAGTSVFSY